jgi:hypothetical protein
MGLTFHICELSHVPYRVLSDCNVLHVQELDLIYDLKLPRQLKLIKSPAVMIPGDEDTYGL